MKYKKGRSKTIILIFVLMNFSKILAQASGFNSNGALNFVKTSTILSTAAAFAPNARRNLSSKRLIENRRLSFFSSKRNYNGQNRGGFVYSISKSTFTTSIKETSGYLDENVSDPSSYSIPPFKKGDDMLADLPKGTRIIRYSFRTKQGMRFILMEPNSDYPVVVLEMSMVISLLYTNFYKVWFSHETLYACHFDGTSFRLSFYKHLNCFIQRVPSQIQCGMGGRQF